MPKLLLSIIAIFAISVSLLQLRQQRLNYRFEINQLHDKIETSQAQLWNQQLKIAGRTNPEAMVRRIQRITPPTPESAAEQASTRPSGSKTPAPPPEPTRRWLDSRVVP